MVEPEGSRTLEDCLARIRQLEEENMYLREAARTFGDLAERLKRALDAERRRAGHGGSYKERPLRDERATVDAGSAGLAK